MKKVAIVIHFDSLGNYYGYPDNYRDPSFFEVFDRFLSFSSKRDFPYTIFVIGKDLTNKENAAQVRKWSELGHEIGSHSWSHPIDIGQLSQESIFNEIYKTHNIIRDVVGFGPKGFTAPAWSHSSSLYDILIKFNYLYDTSPFPSWGICIQYLYWLPFFLINKQFGKIINRGRGLISSASVSRSPFVYRGKKAIGELYAFPLPTTKIGLPCWHSLGFLIGWNYYFKLLKRCLKDQDFFYYLMHVSDLVAPGDLYKKNSSLAMPRGKISIAEKKKQFEQVLDLFRKNRMKIVTMEDFVKSFIKKHHNYHNVK